jgi:hypothetical protein
VRTFPRLLLTILVITFCVPQSALADKGLGIGFTVLPNGDNSKVANNNQLWFALKAGESASRRFQVTSSSDIIQSISFTYKNLLVEDGQVRAGNETSEFEYWFKTDADNLRLSPGDNRIVTLTVKVPKGVSDGVYRSYLRVGASSAVENKVKRTGTYGIVKNDVGFLQQIYVLVGKGQDTLLDFEIDGIQGYLDGSGDKHLKVGFENTGDLPLGLRVLVELNSLEFEGLSFGPYQGGSEPILKRGDKGFADLNVGSDVAEGRYKVRIRASQGEIVKNKVVEVTLDFPESDSNLNGITMLVGIMLLLLGSILALLGIRKVKSNRTKVAEIS